MEMIKMNQSGRLDIISLEELAKNWNEQKLRYEVLEHNIGYLGEFIRLVCYMKDYDIQRISINGRYDEGEVDVIIPGCKDVQCIKISRLLEIGYNKVRQYKENLSEDIAHHL